MSRSDRPAAVFAAAVRADLREAVAWIAREHPAAARGLRDAAIRTAERIGANPFVGATRPRLSADRFRFLPLPGHSDVVAYAADTEPPRILAETGPRP